MPLDPDAEIARLRNILGAMGWELRQTTFEAGGLLITLFKAKPPEGPPGSATTR